MYINYIFFLKLLHLKIAPRIDIVVILPRGWISLRVEKIPTFLSFLLLAIRQFSTIDVI